MLKEQRLFFLHCCYYYLLTHLVVLQAAAASPALDLFTLQDLYAHGQYGGEFGYYSNGERGK
jgi:hypothetical protein